MTTLKEELKSQRKEAFSQAPTNSADPYASYRNASQKILSTLVFFEGCSYEAYKDQIGIDTIGIGNTRHPNGTKVKKGEKINNSQELLEYVEHHLEKEVYPTMKKCIKRDLSPNETAALVSLIYNCGPSVLIDKQGHPTALTKAINNNDKATIEKEWMKHNKTKKGPDRGLTIRRVMELAIMDGKCDPQKLRICTYGSIDLTKICSNGKPIKTPAAYAYMTSTCQKMPNKINMLKFSYFNYGLPVDNFVSNLANEKNATKQQQPPLRLYTQNTR